MSRSRWFLCLLVLAGMVVPTHADEKSIKRALAREVISSRQTLLDVQEFTDRLVPRMPEVKTAEGWNTEARRIRQGVLDKVVFRGEAANWRKAKTRVKYLDAIPGGPGYRIRKLRYEALPGLWIPALLYEPSRLSGKMPVCLAVNGHDRKGKAAPYKQLRCINLAKRGILTLNVEWLGMGQLRSAGFYHYRMNQLDLCGTSGLAPFYLSMTRGLDVLLALPNADAKRVAVSGLSGGGWQTIFVSSLDLRVTLSNPVAGYSSFRTRIRHHKDLGDSEQTPCDLATVADYTHLTALRAPRPTLLTYNAKDQCCFEAGYALPPLMKASQPIFKLFDKEKALRSHINHDPGTHNYEKDNRQAFYRIIGDSFFPGDKDYNREEIPSEKELKSAEILDVPLPKDNADFNTLALKLARSLPNTPALPRNKEAAQLWQSKQRVELSRLVKVKTYKVLGRKVGEEEQNGIQIQRWKLKLGKDWTIPLVELIPSKPKGTFILINDAGRKADPVNAQRLLSNGYRVLAVDLFYFGECKIASRDFLFALLVGAVGERPLGIQASQLNAVVRWAQKERKLTSITVVAVGPRMSLISLVAAALEPRSIAGLELHGSLGSLKQVIEKSRGVNQWPEMFCFGLLQQFDVKQIAALVAPRPIQFMERSDRVKKEMAVLRSWYAILGKKFDPVGGS